MLAPDWLVGPSPLVLVACRCHTDRRRRRRQSGGIMASDPWTILLILAGSISVVVIDKVSQWRLEKQRQAHELLRDQQTRRYEFRLQEY
jgi:hypothetical protein